MSAFEVGVAIPTWNSARTLPEALLSLKRQQGVRARIVVADSGSGDGTLDLCAAAGIEAVYVPVGNMYRAINAGIRRLQAPWVAYLNSDDFVYEDTYARLISRGEALGADVVYGSGDVVDAHGRFLYSLQAASPGALRRLFGVVFFGFMPHAAVFRRSLFERLSGFDESFRHVADMEFFARACFNGALFASVPFPSVAGFRIHPEQISGRERDLVRHELAQLRGRWQEGNGLAARLAVLEWKMRNAGHYLVRLLRTGSCRRAS